MKKMLLENTFSKCLFLLNKTLWATILLGIEFPNFCTILVSNSNCALEPRRRVIQTISQATVCCNWFNYSCGVPQLLQQVNDLVWWLFVKSTSLVLLRSLEIIWENGFILRLIPAPLTVRYPVALTNLFYIFLHAALIVFCLMLFFPIISTLSDVLL